MLRTGVNLPGWVWICAKISLLWQAVVRIVSHEFILAPDVITKQLQFTLFFIWATGWWKLILSWTLSKGKDGQLCLCPRHYSEAHFWRFNMIKMHDQTWLWRKIIGEFFGHGEQQTEHFNWYLRDYVPSCLGTFQCPLLHVVHCFSFLEHVVVVGERSSSAALAGNVLPVS